MTKNRRRVRLIDNVGHYRCTGPCKRWLPCETFPPLKSGDSRCGRRSNCAACARKLDAVYKREARLRRKAGIKSRRQEQAELDARWMARLREKGWTPRRLVSSRPIRDTTTDFDAGLEAIVNQRRKAS